MAAIFSSRKFKDVIRRQLTAFVSENELRFNRAIEAHNHYHRESDPDLAMIHLAEHDEIIEDLEIDLAEMRDQFCPTISDEKASRSYIDQFNKAARRDLPVAMHLANVAE